MLKWCLVVAACLMAVGCSEEGSIKGDVGMTSAHAFEPEELTVQVGDTVTFSNDSSESHTVTAYEDGLPDGATYFASGDFASEQEARDDVAGGLIKPGKTFDVTFDEPGTYRYFCIPHESDGMAGTIVVEK